MSIYVGLKEIMGWKPWAKRVEESHKSLAESIDVQYLRYARLLDYLGLEEFHPPLPQGTILRKKKNEKPQMGAKS